MASLSVESPLFTVAEAADYLRISKSFLDHDRVGAARIPFHKYGSRVFYHRQDLDAFIAAGRRRSTSEPAGAAEVAL